VELANRLRRIQLFDFASVDELFRIAGLGRQVRHEPGRVLYEAGRPAESLQFLLDGRVAADENGSTREIAAPDVLGFEAVLEGSPMPATLRALETAICLSLTTDEFLSLLSENVEIAQGIFRLLIDRRGRPGWHTVLRGRMGRSLERRVDADAGLQAVDRILLLQSSPLLSRATAAQLVGLAGIARPVPLKAGSDPLSGAEPAILVVLSGVLKVEREGSPSMTADSGDAVGVYETLGDVPFPVRSEVVTEGQGLKFLRSDLFDLLADNVDLLQGIFSGLLRAPMHPAETEAAPTT
jgi:CRP-like cAMP-binding protein